MIPNSNIDQLLQSVYSTPYLTQFLGTEVPNEAFPELSNEVLNVNQQEESNLHVTEKKEKTIELLMEKL